MWLRQPLVALILREPLTHFVVLGLAIYVAISGVGSHSDESVIHIGQDEIDRTTTLYAQQYGAMPTRAQLRSLIDAYIREEIMYREGRALHIDENDEIVRRRVAQKYQFLMQDNTAPTEPGESEMLTWFRSNAARYREPARRTIDQVYFAVDQRGEAAARLLATAAKTRLANGGQALSSDEFPGAKVVRLVSQSDADRLFGDGEFARSVFATEPYRWAGPFRSGFGWHAIRVTEVQPSRALSFNAARDEVRRDLIAAKIAARQKQFYAKLLARYHVSFVGGAR